MENKSFKHKIQEITLFLKSVKSKAYLMTLIIFFLQLRWDKHLKLMLNKLKISIKQ